MHLTMHAFELLLRARRWELFHRHCMPDTRLRLVVMRRENLRAAAVLADGLCSKVCEFGSSHGRPAENSIRAHNQAPHIHLLVDKNKQQHTTNNTPVREINLPGPAHSPDHGACRGP